MIKSFGDKDTEKIMSNDRVKGISAEIQRQTKKRLNLLNTAMSLDDVAVFRGWRLEKLSGSDFWSIRVNKQYRIVFKFENNNFYEVKLTKHYE